MVYLLDIVHILITIYHLKSQVVLARIFEITCHQSTIICNLNKKSNVQGLNNCYLFLHEFVKETKLLNIHSFVEIIVRGLFVENLLAT
jgi:hypothetical protein